MRFINALSLRSVRRPFLFAVLASLVGTACQERDTADRAAPDEASFEEPVTHPAEQVDTLFAASETREPGLQLFSSVDMARASDGTLYFIDVPSSALVRLTVGDSVLTRVGRAGRGPGDLGRPCCVRLAPGDSEVIVIETANRRYSVFDRDLVYQRSVSLDIDHSASMPVGVDGTGRLVLVRNNGTQPGILAPNEISAFDSAGVVSGRDTVVVPRELTPVTAVVDDGKGVAMTMGQPFGPQLLSAAGPNGEYALANSGTARVRIRHPDGRWSELQGRGGTGPAVTETERTETMDRVRSNLANFGKTPSDLPFGAADHKPPIQAIFFDLDGRLWMQRTVSDSTQQLADVYQPDGQHVGLFSWPAGIRLAPFAVRGLSAVGFGTNPDGFPYIVQIRFSPAR